MQEMLVAGAGDRGDGGEFDRAIPRSGEPRCARSAAKGMGTLAAAPDRCRRLANPGTAGKGDDEAALAIWSPAPGADAAQRHGGESEEVR